MGLSLTKLEEVRARGALNVNVASLVDKSTSMSWGSEPGERGESRWNVSTKINTEVTRKVCEFDDDGIDLIFFNGSFKLYEGVTAAKVRDIFAMHSPNGGTDLAPPLKAMVEKYLPAKVKTPAKPGGLLHKATPVEYERISPEKPVALLIWTDGAPGDRDKVEEVIIDASRRIKRDEDFGIAIIQVGHDEGASKWLKTLDNGLEAKGASFDVVAVVHLDELLANKLSEEDIIRVAFTG